MTAHTDALRSDGVRRIIAFNWPKLLAGVAAILAGSVIAGAQDGLVRVGALLGASSAAYLVVSSLVVSWWVYDRSDLHSWQWLQPLLPPEMRHWALLHAGFDESAPTLTAALGAADAVVDVSPGLTHLSRSLRRARHRIPAATFICADGSRLPIATGSLDAVMLVFAAHEVRDAPQREALFDELRRVLRPAGRVVMVEHLRDCANVVAFGPGAWHFQTRREWTRLAARSGFDTMRVVNQTVFVRGLALWAS